MVKVKIGFGRYNDKDLLLFTDNVLSKVPKLSQFSDIYPNVSVVTALRDKFRDDLIAAQNGGKAEIANKNQTRRGLEVVLKQWGSYIEDHANNNEALVIETGYLIHQKPAQNAVPDTPQDVHITDGALSGGVKAQCKKVPDATAYELRHRQDKDTDWTMAPVSFVTKIELPNIAPPGTVIWVQIRALNTYGHSNWSDPATIMVR